MAILKRTIEEGPLIAQGEEWELKNGLVFDISFGNKTEVHVSSQSGDVTDQIFNILVQLEKYKNITLRAMECYYIQVDKHLIKDFMDSVEKIDISQLKQGKVY